MAQISPDERIATYLKSIKQWLYKTNFKIVLLENSGYTYEELNYEKQQFRHRFEVITFIESRLKEAAYLRDNNSKGASEIFAIDYAFKNSKLIHSGSVFIIKITGRYYIPELEEYLAKYNMDDFNSLTQNNKNRCEMVGCHYKTFSRMFDINLLDQNNNYDGHIENIWKYRAAQYNNVFTCKELKIEKTKTGGMNLSYEII